MMDKSASDTCSENVSFNRDSLMKELEEENNFLMKLVNTIPAQMYFDHSIQEKLTAERHSAMDRAAEEIKRLSCNHIELSAKGKYKRARLDPSNQKSVSQIHEELNARKRNKRKKRKSSLISSESLNRAANIEELQKRLQEKIQLFRTQRKVNGHDPKEMIANKRMQKKLKKLKARGNKLKAQDLSKIEKPPPVEKKDKSGVKPVFNKDSNIIYSKFDFRENDGEDSKKVKPASKKIKSLLKDVEVKQEKIEKLKEVDPEKAESLVEKEKWKKAILKSEGVKVRDDPTLLKKSLKSEMKRKKKSAKAWKERTEDVEKKKKARQDKRDRNIKQKKKDKLDRKLKLARKKGRLIPGSRK